MPRRALPLLAVVGLLVGHASTAGAQDPGPAPVADTVMPAAAEPPPPPFADLLRLELTAEGLANVRGGIESEGAAGYRGLIDLFLTLHSADLGLWSGGTLFVHGQNAHGSGISDTYVGSLQALSGIEAHAFTQLSELWVRQRLGRWELKVGKQDANRDFGATRYGDPLIHSSFGMPPNAIFPAFPDPALGISAFGAFLGSGRVGAGLYEDPGPGGLVTVAQVDLPAPFQQSHPGQYRLGVWHQPAPDAPDGVATARNYGVYLLLDQHLFRPASADEESARGLGVFTQVAWAPEDRNAIGLYLGGGLTYTGPLRSRLEDVVGIGVAHVHAGSADAGLEGVSETAVEWTYRLQLGSLLSAQAMVQYIRNPGGTGRDSLVPGLRLQAAF